MKVYVFAGLLASLAVAPLKARSYVQEVYDKELDKLNPMSAKVPEDESGLIQDADYQGHENLESEALVKDPDELYRSQNDYFTEHPTDLSQEILLINESGPEGQKKYQLNLESLGDLTFPQEETEELSWWDEFVDFFENMFS